MILLKDQWHEVPHLSGMARQLNINKGLASELRRKAETSLKAPKDVDKAREAVVALGELKSYLEELEVKTERVLRS